MDDSISRQAAIRWVKTECNPYGKPTLDFESGKKVIDHLKQMPSAERKKGRWIDVTDGIRVWKVCDQCGEKPLWNEWKTDRDLSSFCPKCGAEMKGEEAE